MVTEKTTYLVTGATGYVGSTVCKKLMAKGERVRGLSLRNDDKKIKLAFGDNTPEIIYGDVRNIEQLEQLFLTEGSLVVIHTAAVVTIGEHKLDKMLYDVNVNGTANVIALCLKHKVKRLVQVSSVHAIPERGSKGKKIVEVSKFDADKVVGKYGKSKAIASELVLNAVREQGLDAVIVHPSGIIGPHDPSNTHMTEMMLAFIQGHIPASMKGIYDYVDVRDVADGVIAAVDKGRKGECYLLTGGQYSIIEIFEEIAKHTGQKVPRPVPMWVARLGVPFLAIYFHAHHKRPLYTNYALYTLNSNSNFCHDKATKEWGYAPRPLSESVADSIAFYRQKNWMK